MEAWVQIDINTLDTAAIERGIEKCSKDVITYSSQWPMQFGVHEIEEVQDAITNNTLNTLHIWHVDGSDGLYEVVPSISGGEMAKLLLLLRFSSPMCIVDIKTLRQFEWLAEIGSSLNEPLDTV